MKAEKYIIHYLREHNIAYDKIKQDIGIDMYKVENRNIDLLADDFLRLCLYLGLTPEEISDQIL